MGPPRRFLCISALSRIGRSCCRRATSSCKEGGYCPPKIAEPIKTERGLCFRNVNTAIELAFNKRFAVRIPVPGCICSKVPSFVRTSISFTVVVKPEDLRCANHKRLIGAKGVLHAVILFNSDHFASSKKRRIAIIETITTLFINNFYLSKNELAIWLHISISQYLVKISRSLSRYRYWSFVASQQFYSTLLRQVLHLHALALSSCKASFHFQHQLCCCKQAAVERSLTT
jgi:hypothetical protein